MRKALDYRLQYMEHMLIIWHIQSMREVNIMVQPSAHASHILVKSKGEATQMAANINKFKDFQKFARKKSDCPSCQKGGDLGWFRKGQMVPAFDQVVWELPLNTVSTPVKTQFGYHLIWVHEREE